MDKNNCKKKLVADDLYKIPISLLKLNKFLKTSLSGTIDIPYKGRSFRDGVHLVVSCQNKDEPHLYFYYDVLQPDGRYRAVEYRVDLDVTKCNYGGQRYWYRCPVEILGCDRRVGVLYKVGDYLACGRCFSVTYESRKLSGVYKKFGVVNMPELLRQELNFKRLRYKGKPTKKFLRFSKKYEKAMALAKTFNKQGDNRLKKYQEKYDKFIGGMVTNINGLTALNMPAGYTAGKLCSFIIHIATSIDGLNKTENANISGSLDNSPSAHRPFLTIKVPNSYFHDPKGIVRFDSDYPINFKIWHISRPGSKSEVTLEVRFYFICTGSDITAKEITCFDEFARSLGFESENKLFDYEPGIFGGYAQIGDDSGKLYWTKTI